MNIDSPYYILVFVGLIAVGLILYVMRQTGRRKKVKNLNLSEDYMDNVLIEKVRFYRLLSADDRAVFLKRVRYFLSTTKISAEKGVVVLDEDKVLVAASATIPLFHFQNWAYENLDEVLIYPDAFDERFGTMDEDERNIVGMVGNGALNHKMILSLHALRMGFQKYPDGHTAIHEFVHLIDKADGEIDGVPEYLIPKDLIAPWVAEMEKTIRQIRQGKSDIRDYAATNEAEFLAVVTEYFFKKPTLLQEDHPRLYAMLDEIYNRKNTFE